MVFESDFKKGIFHVEKKMVFELGSCPDSCPDVGNGLTGAPAGLEVDPARLAARDFEPEDVAVERGHRREIGREENNAAQFKRHQLGPLSRSGDGRNQGAFFWQVEAWRGASRPPCTRQPLRDGLRRGFLGGRP